MTRLTQYTFLALFVLVQTNSAHAGFQRWTASVKNNPFSGGKDVSVLYIVNANSQIQIVCDSAKQGIRMTVIPGYEASPAALSRSPTVRIAVDGEIILSKLVGMVNTFGANLAGVSVELTKSAADTMTAAFVSARRQIAIEDGMSNGPHLLTARGSTAAARKVQQCYRAQKGTEAAPAADADATRNQQIAEIEQQVRDLQARLRTLKGEE